MIFATFYDLFTMTIPNKLTLALVVGFAILAPLAGMGWETMLWHVAIAAIALVIGFIFFSFGFMGGGDAKLIAASALWFGTAFTLPYIFITGILGGVLTLAIVIGRHYPMPIWAMKIDWLMRLHNKKEKVPYGAALGPAALLVFIDTPWADFIISGKLLG